MQELSDYELSQLNGMEPRLSDDWRAITANIIPKLTRESQQIVMDKILKPKGLLYDNAQKKFMVLPAPTLSEVCKANPTDNKQLSKAILQMMDFLDAPPPP